MEYKVWSGSVYGSVVRLNNAVWTFGVTKRWEALDQLNDYKILKHYLLLGSYTNADAPTNNEGDMMNRSHAELFN